MTASKRIKLSKALFNANRAAQKNKEAQDAMHEAFEELYGFEFDVEALGGDDWVDSLVYGQGPAPTVAEIDQAVSKMKEQ